MWSLLLMCDSSGATAERPRHHRTPLIWWNLTFKFCLPKWISAWFFSFPDVFSFPAGIHMCSSGISQGFEGSYGEWYSDVWAPSLWLYIFWDFCTQFPAVLGPPNPSLWFLSPIRLAFCLRLIFCELCRLGDSSKESHINVGHSLLSRVLFPPVFACYWWFSRAFH